MNYPDTVKLATVSADGYGDKTIEELDTVPAAFIKRAGIARTLQIEGETSSAAVYLLPTHATVLEKKDELEGMYIQAEPFTDNSWYRVDSVNIAERKLLDNTIDNIYCRLEKVAGIPYVRNS